MQSTLSFLLELAKVLESDSDTVGKACYTLNVWFVSSQVEKDCEGAHSLYYATASLVLAHKMQEKIRDLDSVAVCHLYLLENTSEGPY